MLSGKCLHPSPCAFYMNTACSICVLRHLRLAGEGGEKGSPLWMVDLHALSPIGLRRAFVSISLQVLHTPDHAVYAVCSMGYSLSTAGVQPYLAAMSLLGGCATPIAFRLQHALVL